jgi:hypothetical protein
VTVGRKYVIAALGLYDGLLLSLMCDDTGYPVWLPVGLFSVAVSELPTHWKFCICDGIAASGGTATVGTLGARWGYPELVTDPAHNDPEW